MRYLISEDVSFEEATPRGLLQVAFKAGEIEVEPGSDEQYAIEYVLIPAELATVAADKPASRAHKPKVEAPEAPAEPAVTEPVPAPADVEPEFIPAS